MQKKYYYVLVGATCGMLIHAFLALAVHVSIQVSVFVNSGGPIGVTPEALEMALKYDPIPMMMFLIVLYGIYIISGVFGGTVCGLALFWKNENEGKTPRNEYLKRWMIILCFELVALLLLSLVILYSFRAVGSNAMSNYIIYINSYFFWGVICGLILLREGKRSPRTSETMDNNFMFRTSCLGFIVGCGF